MMLTFRLCLLIFIIGLVNGCSTKPITNAQTTQSIDERTQQLLQLNDWQLTGKIAFIQSSKRESASLSWHYNDTDNSQELDLNSYLGINVLHLTSNNNLHTIEVDGKTYKSRNLDQLITSLTGFNLPTKALVYWLKGLPFSANDKIQYHDDTQLPVSLTSEYNNQLWQINYANYQPNNGVQLASSFTLKQHDLLIKISIKKWTF